MFRGLQCLTLTAVVLDEPGLGELQGRSSRGAVKQTHPGRQFLLQTGQQLRLAEETGGRRVVSQQGDPRSRGRGNKDGEPGSE